MFPNFLAILKSLKCCTNNRLFWRITLISVRRKALIVFVFCCFQFSSPSWSSCVYSSVSLSGESNLDMRRSIATISNIFFETFYVQNKVGQRIVRWIEKLGLKWTNCSFSFSIITINNSIINHLRMERKTKQWSTEALRLTHINKWFRMNR